MIRHAEAEWKGSLKEGSGQVKTETGALSSAYSFRSRFEGGGETNPEELIAAAHAACFSMALSAALSAAGHVPNSVRTAAARATPAACYHGQQEPRCNWVVARLPAAALDLEG